MLKRLRKSQQFFPLVHQSRTLGNLCLKKLFLSKSVVSVMHKDFCFIGGIRSHMSKMSMPRVHKSSKKMKTLEFPDGPQSYSSNIREHLLISIIPHIKIHSCVPKHLRINSQFAQNFTPGNKKRCQNHSD